MPGRTDEVWKSSSLASLYLEGVRAAIPLANEQIDVMLRLIGALGAPVRRFLDLGCGDGVLSWALAERFPDAHGVLADFSEPMLDAARKRFSQRPGSARFVNIDYGLATWPHSVHEYGPYDVVVSGYSIHHQTDTRKREIYREIFDLLGPGGLFINVEHVSSPTPWIAGVHGDLVIDHLQLHQPGKSRRELAEVYYNRPDKAANILAPVEAQCQWLGEIGFTDVDCYLKIFELAVFGGRKPA